MSIFVPHKVYLRGILLHYFIQKKSAAEAHRILVQTYGDNALSDTTCRDWFRRFKNNDFELEDQERSGAPRKFQDKELEQLLDEDPSQTLSELGKILQVDESTVSKRLKGLGMIQKQGHWVPYELHGLKSRGQYFVYLVPSMSPGDKAGNRIATLDGSMQRVRIEAAAILPRDPIMNSTIFFQRYPEDNARPHVAASTTALLNQFSWDVLTHPPYSPDLAPSDYHLFTKLKESLAGKRFQSDEEVQTAVTNWTKELAGSFYAEGILKLVSRYTKCIEIDGNYVEKD
ncbi:MOS1T transposase, partial [Pseudoatta argentina]